ncbi:MAG: 3-deoxy-manno-octulosonate cytidylyltransferase [Cellvibrionaceae bacterium]|nr:3-deoxy-manno-octulosonate cytidylyltransferase [Cellvibrionaceae bacterium]
MTPFSVIIPARYGSTRLPAKPLKLIAGRPMIQWVYEAACRSSAAAVWIATDDQRVADVASAFGALVCMTRPDHESGTDRLQEVVAQLGLADDAIVVNVQGDEPLLPPAVIDQVACNLAGSPDASVATLSEPLHHVADCFNPNIVKVVSDLHQKALYFSRAPIPWGRDTYSSPEPQLPAAALAQRHIGLYAYRVALLHQFVTWPVAALEGFEKLEQLRVLANGHRIHVAPACVPVPGGVDTPDDLARVKRLLEQHQ